MSDTNKPLINANPYPSIDQQPNPVYVPPQQTYNQRPPNTSNQVYQVSPYPQPVNNNQGFQPQYQYSPPPPPPVQQQQQILITMPAYVTTAHPKYRFIVQQAGLPCAICSYRGVDQISMTPGCTAYTWSIILFLFTGIFCFWIPFVCDSCKDIRVSCSKCRHTKAIIEKPCC